MIIGESNLIIGKIFSVVSSFSITAFFYFEKSINYIIKEYKNIFFKIKPLANSPPFFI